MSKEELTKVLEEKFLTPIKFSYEIEKIVLHQKMNYIDAIVEYCSNNDIEVENVSKLLSRPLKEKLKADATELNYLKKTSRGKLPV